MHIHKGWLLAPAGADLGPGSEESGGYVDPERHRY